MDAGSQIAAGISEVIARAIAHAIRPMRPPRPLGDDSSDSDPCPIVPNQPLNLSGGSAAALEFDD